MKRIILLILLGTIPALTFSQMSRNRWKAFRWELDLGVGASNFLGDLGGANQIGTHYFKDFEFSMTRAAFSLGARYKILERLAIHPHLTYGKVSGDDKKTEEFFRNNRNLNFKSNIWELNVNLEAFILKEQIGHRYVYKGVKGQRGFEVAAYVFLGAGVFHFDPKGELEGQWYKLQPLGTEGQGLAPSREKYARYQFCIPVGVGFKYTVDRRWGVGFEFGMRKTFTDYIDDVSKTYYDKGALAQYNGATSAALSDKRESQYDTTYPGAQRGNPKYKDSYMFAVLSINYKLRFGKMRYPIF